ncbi:MAG: NADH-quinone oxidoreductase subunit H [Halobacteriales archaeon]|nr:NADH-quinone oxidoreductase subunit H [Halobacteriales archaeon]
MTLDASGTGFIAYVLAKLAGLVGLHPSDMTLFVLSAIILGLIILILVLTIVPGFVWGMRKIMADIQSREGPNRVGPFGILQVLADGVKMMTKEDIIPARADRFGFILAPFVMIVPVLLAFAPLPWSGGVILSNVGAGILFILAIGAISPLGEVLAGWSSNNKYAMYGGLRAAAMDVSYEIPMIISALSVVFLAGTLNTEGIVAAQQPWWFFLLQPIGVVVFFIAALAKIGVVPLDLPESESELVAGYFTEYSGMRYGVFMLSLFANIFLMSAITVTLFFGGWGIMPPWAVAGVVLTFAAILLARRKGMSVNIAPPAIMGTMVGVVLAYGAGIHGIAQGVLASAYGPDVAAHFFDGTNPGNFIATLAAAYDFLVPAAIVASIFSVIVVAAERGTRRDMLPFPAVALAMVILVPTALLLLAPFLYVGVQGGIIVFVLGGLKLLILGVKPIVMVLVLGALVGVPLFLLLQATNDLILAGVLATLVPLFVPMLLIPITSFLLKSLFFSFLVFWVWFTLPRVRVDQFLRIGWRTMFPLSLLTLTIAGVEAWILRGGAL